MQHRRARTRDVVVRILSHNSSLPEVRFEFENKNSEAFEDELFFLEFLLRCYSLEKARRVLENLVPLNPNDRNCDNKI